MSLYSHVSDDEKKLVESKIKNGYTVEKFLAQYTKIHDLSKPGRLTSSGREKRITRKRGFFLYMRLCKLLNRNFSFLVYELPDIFFNKIWTAVRSIVHNDGIERLIMKTLDQIETNIMYCSPTDLAKIYLPLRNEFLNLKCQYREIEIRIKVFYILSVRTLHLPEDLIEHEILSYIL